MAGWPWGSSSAATAFGPWVAAWAAETRVMCDAPASLRGRQRAVEEVEVEVEAPKGDEQ